MITSNTDSPLVSFIKAQVPIAARLAEGIRIDHATLCALVEAHDAWAETLRPRPATAQPLEADVTAVAALFKRSRSWVYLQLRDGRFPGAYVDRRGTHRFPQSCLDAFIAAERHATPSTTQTLVATASPATSVRRSLPPRASTEQATVLTTPAAPATPALTVATTETQPTTADNVLHNPAPSSVTPEPSVAAMTTTATSSSPTASRPPRRPRPSPGRVPVVPTAPAELTWDAWRAGRPAPGPVV